MHQRVHVPPSWMDMVNLEATINRTPVVGSTFGHELEYLQNDAYLVDPASPESILEGVVNAIKDQGKSEKKVGLKKNIRKYNWEQCTNATERLQESYRKRLTPSN